MIVKNNRDVAKELFDRHECRQDFIDSEYEITFPSIDENFYELSHFLQYEFLVETGIYSKHTNGNNCFIVPDMNGILKPVPENYVNEFENDMAKDYYKYIEETLQGVNDNDLVEQCNQELKQEKLDKEHQTKKIILL